MVWALEPATAGAVADAADEVECLHVGAGNRLVGHLRIERLDEQSIDEGAQDLDPHLAVNRKQLSTKVESFIVTC